MKHIQHLEKIVESDSNTVCALVFVIQRSDCVIFQPTKGRNIVISFCGGFPKCALPPLTPFLNKIKLKIGKKVGGIFFLCLKSARGWCYTFGANKKSFPHIVNLYKRRDGSVLALLEGLEKRVIQIFLEYIIHFILKRSDIWKGGGELFTLTLKLLGKTFFNLDFILPKFIQSWG